MAGVPVRPAGTELSGAAQLRGGAARPLGRGRRRRPALLIAPPRDLDLRASCRAREPHRQCADARSRSGARQSRAAARPNNPMMVRPMFAVHQGRRRSASPRCRCCAPRNWPIDRQGADRTGALRRAPFRRDGEGRGAGARSASARRLGRQGRCPRSADGAAGDEPFTACDTAADDVCLIAFTSGTTGGPKGTMHFHRDVLAICDARPARAAGHPDDRFIGTPPLAFTFGLGGLVLFPMRFGAATLLLEKGPPDELLAAIDRLRRHGGFTAPTAYPASRRALRRHPHGHRACTPSPYDSRDQFIYDTDLLLSLRGPRRHASRRATRATSRARRPPGPQPRARGRTEPASRQRGAPAPALRGSR